MLPLLRMLSNDVAVESKYNRLLLLFLFNSSGIGRLEISRKCKIALQKIFRKWQQKLFKKLPLPTFWKKINRQES